MSSLYCRKTRKWLLGLIPAEDLKCDKDPRECLSCENFIDPCTLVDNTDQDEYEGALFRPMENPEYLAMGFNVTREDQDWSGQVFSP